MGVFSGSASYVRYQVQGDVPEPVKDFVLEKLKGYAFKEIDPGTLSEKTIGWVSAENMALTRFDDLHFAKDPYLVFSLRIDVRKIPGMTMKAALLREEMKYKETTGQERLRKKDKDMLKDEVWQALTKKTLPTPSVYDVCWNFQTGIVLFFSTSRKANEEFMAFFHRSFDVKLLPLMPQALATHLGEKNNKFFDVSETELQFAHG